VSANMPEAPVRLRPELSFSPVRTRGNVAYVIEDRIHHKFWKIGSLEYEVCSALDGSTTALDALKSLMQRSSLAVAAGPERVHKILVWLMQSGLIESCSIPTTSFEATNLHEDKPVSEKPPERPKKLFDPSFFRIPILSGDIIEKFARPLTWLVSLPCLMAAVIVWCIAISSTYQNNQDLMGLGKKLFVPGSQWWWLFAWVILKFVHESGHAIACTRIGAKTNGAGIGFMFFAPSPFVDVTNLWSNDNKWSRMLVSSAGMLFELTLSALAIIGACWFENPTLRYLCFSIATLGTFTTVAFNGNPLMRYDGYYILIDWIGRPNLWQDASLQMKQFFASLLFKATHAQCISVPLLAYGTAGWISRMLLLATMGWGVWKTWDGIGLVVVVFFVCLWFIIPSWMRMISKPASTQPWTWQSLFANICPWKAMRLTFLAAGLALCSLLPSPMQVYWPAIVDYVDPSDVRTGAAGFVQEVYVHDGQGVRAGDEILRLSNPSLELEYQAAVSMLKTSDEKCVAFRAQRKHSELQTEEALYESLLVKCKSLEGKVESLRLRAPRDGVLIARLSYNLPGSFLPEGQSIGIVADPTQIEVKASIPQDAWDVVSQSVQSPVAIHASNGDRWMGKLNKTLPRTSDTLDSPSQGGIYGGPIAVVMGKGSDGADKLTTSSPRLQSRIEFDQSTTAAVLPPPGLHCSIRLADRQEKIYQSITRWFRALLNSRFDETTY
jgi:putative peptide zinc metalloprotease protein